MLALLAAGCTDGVDVSRWPAGTIRGFNVACWWRGCLDRPVAERTLQRASELGATDVALVLTWYVPDGSTGTPAEDPRRSSTLSELERAARRARAAGLQLMLKPHVNRIDGGSRTEISPAALEPWWQAYRRYVLAVAELAARVGARSIAVGTELTRVSVHEQRWRQLIADVRERFTGTVTYAANWDELEGLAFVDALDWVGVDGYYPLGGGHRPGAFDQLTGWQVHLARLQRMDAVRSRPLVFTELGTRSADPQAQATSYRAALVALRDQGGVLFWNLWEGPNGGTHVLMPEAQALVQAAWR